MSSNFNIAEAVENAFQNHAIVDIHTHLYPHQMGPLYLAGPDELITYHYLKAECSRQLPADMSVDAFNTMSKPEQADIIWKTLFVGNSSPVSEAQRGIVTVMKCLGLSPRVDDLSEFRTFYNDQNPEDYTNMVLKESGVGKVYMTNDPMDDTEGPMWNNGFEMDPRFKAVLRLDSALIHWPGPVENLQAMGYDVEADLSEKTYSELRRYLHDWCDKMDAQYMAISLPPDFAYPSEDSITQLMKNVVYPTAQERGIPSAMMIGVTRQVNPVLRDGGDSLGKWNITCLENIARDFPDVPFLITLLSRENQHELCVTARKFPNIMPFGCWWFLNNPSVIQEITSERFELLGTSFIPQHSDARILDQLLYKWTHSIQVIAPVFAQKYEALSQAGWPLTEADIQRDVATMFGGGNVLN
ncbi:MAG: glucuronate isomerase [bacterium]|nr:glucuronate isomerase [bacterium]